MWEEVGQWSLPQVGSGRGHQDGALVDHHAEQGQGALYRVPLGPFLQVLITQLSHMVQVKETGEEVWYERRGGA